MIIIQKIETFWTKKSRGFPGSKKRSEVTDLVFKGLTNNYSEEATVLQCISHNENGDFEPNYKEREINSNQVRQEQLELQMIENDLYVSFWGRNSSFGKARKIGNLKINSWLQFLINERIPLEYTSSYKKLVYNIVFTMNEKNLLNLLRNKPKVKLDLQTKIL